MFNGKNECCGYPALKHPNVLYKSLLRSSGIRSFHWDQRIYILRERTRTAPPVVLSRRCLSPPALSAVIQTDREYRSSIQQTKQRKASQFKRGGGGCCLFCKDIYSLIGIHRMYCMISLQLECGLPWVPAIKAGHPGHHSR